MYRPTRRSRPVTFESIHRRSARAIAPREIASAALAGPRGALPLTAFHRFRELPCCGRQLPERHPARARDRPAIAALSSAPLEQGERVKHAGPGALPAQLGERLAERHALLAAVEHGCHVEQQPLTGLAARLDQLLKLGEIDRPARW